jgi:hypothetical protein
MSLKDILAASKQTPKEPEWNLGEVLWAYQASLSDAEDESREEGFHPSQLFDFCPRRSVLAHFFPKPGEGYFSPETRTRFDWGTAWHWFVQNHYFGTMGLLYGSWRCNRCGKVMRDSLMPPPDLDCTPSTGPRHEAEIVRLVQAEKEIAAGKRVRRGGYWTYQEMRVHTEEGIVGHIDGILVMPWGEKVLLEVKTMDGKWFKSLSTPDPKYIFQISVYLWALGIDRCLLTYFSKDADAPKPKTFWVKRDDGVVEAVKSRIALYKMSWPEKRLCVGNCKRDTERAAERCSHRLECFREDIEEVVEKMRATA